MLSRRSAPTWVKETGRAVTRTVGQLTADTRMQPDFLMVGAQRSGTTSLYRCLAAHPAVTPPLFHKGVHYFDVNYGRGPAWYQGHFPVRTLAGRRTRAAAAAPITGESSGYYMHHPLAPSRIAADLPHVKLLVLLRDPVERAYSAHRHEYARGFETEEFEPALELEQERLAGEVDRMRADPHYVSFSHRHHSYVDRGRYVHQLSLLVDLFGRERILVLDSEDFFASPERTFDRVVSFLGLPSWRPDSFGRINARPRAPMPESVRRRLDEHFFPYDEALAALLEETPRWRA